MFRKNNEKREVTDNKIEETIFAQTAEEVWGIHFTTDKYLLKHHPESLAYDAFAVQIRLNQNPDERERFLKVYEAKLNDYHLKQDPDYYDKYLKNKLEKLDQIAEDKIFIELPVGTTIDEAVRISKELIKYYQTKNIQIKSVSFSFNDVLIEVDEQNSIEEIKEYYYSNINKSRTH